MGLVSADTARRKNCTAQKERRRTNQINIVRTWNWVSSDWLHACTVLHSTSYAYPVHIFFCDSVVLESICYSTKANQLKNENNYDWRAEKNSDGMSILTVFLARYTKSCTMRTWWSSQKRMETTKRRRNKFLRLLNGILFWRRSKSLQSKKIYGDRRDPLILSYPFAMWWIRKFPPLDSIPLRFVFGQLFGISFVAAILWCYRRTLHRPLLLLLLLPEFRSRSILRIAPDCCSDDDDGAVKKEKAT